MKIFVEDDNLVDVPHTSLKKGDHYEFPCGCRVPIAQGEPRVFGHSPLIYNQEDISLECPQVWKLLRNGYTKGVFQLESPLGKHGAKELKPESIHHLAGLMAVLRPGCLQARDEEPWSLYFEEPKDPPPNYVVVRRDGTSIVGKVVANGEVVLEGNPDNAQKLEKKLANVEGLGDIPENVKAGLIKAVMDGLGYAKPRGYSMTEHYYRRKNEVEEVTYLHPALEPILGPTYGILVYQEQSMEIAKQLCGFDLKEADVLRKAIGSKNTALMSTIEADFLEKAQRTGIIPDGVARTLFQNIRASQRYSFNASHAYAYAVNSYRSAYAKAHFPLLFFTSYLYYAKEKQDPTKEVRQLMAEAKNFGIAVTTPRLSTLRDHFGTDGIVIEFGLCDVKAVGDSAFRKIKERLATMDAPPSTWPQFLMGVADHIPATAVRRMIEVGALREISKAYRQRMLAEFDAWGRLTDREKTVVAEKDDIVEGIEHLLTKVVGYTKGTKKEPGRPKYICTAARKEKVESMLALLKKPPAPLVDSPHWVAKVEEELLGVPVTVSETQAADRSIVTQTVEQWRAGKGGKFGSQAILGVCIDEIVVRQVRNGENRGRSMASLTVSDETGSFEDVVVFPEAYEEYGYLLARPGAIVAIGGKRSFRDESTFIVEKVWEM